MPQSFAVNRGVSRRANAYSLGDKSQKVIVVPAGEQAFVLYAEFDALFPFKQVQGNMVEPGAVFVTVGRGQQQPAPPCHKAAIAGRAQSPIKISAISAAPRATNVIPSSH